MRFKSTKNTHNVYQSNENYEAYGIIFASRFVYKTIESIDRNLRFLYTPGSASNNWETINHSLVRDNDGEFDDILGRVEERIGRIMATDDGSTNQFLYKEKCDGVFFEEFDGILDCINEGVCLRGEYKNNFERRITDIVKGLSNIGIDPYKNNFERGIIDIVESLPKIELVPYY